MINKCIIFVGITLNPNDKSWAFNSCSKNECRNIDSIKAEELITVLLQPTSQLAVFSYVFVQSNQCKVLTSVK